MNMNIQREWYREGRLDELEARKRTVLIHFGRESDQEKRKKMIEVFKQLDRKYRDLLPFEQYQMIKQEEVRILVLLHKFENEEQLKEQKIKHLKQEIREKEKKVQQAKKDVEDNMKIRKMLKEIKQMTKTKSQIHQQEIAISSMKQLVWVNQKKMDQVKQSKEQIADLNKAFIEYEEQLKKQSEIKETLEKRKKEVTIQLNDLSKEIFKLNQKQEKVGSQRSRSEPNNEKVDNSFPAIKIEENKTKNKSNIFTGLVVIIIVLVFFNIYKYMVIGENKQIRNDICQ